MNKSKPYKHWLRQDIKPETKSAKNYMIGLKELSHLRTELLIETQLMFYWTQFTRIIVLNYSQRLFKIKEAVLSYIKRIRKDYSGISSLIIKGDTNSCTKDKARIINNQFESVFSLTNTYQISQ